MRKIPSLYVRDLEDMAHVTREVNPACRWVIEDADLVTTAVQSDGAPVLVTALVTATVKHDGTCILLDTQGAWWTRHQVRPDKTAPDNYVPVETDPATGKTQGWIPFDQSSYRKHLRKAIDWHTDLGEEFEPGTYELVGPGIGRNPHALSRLMLIRHGSTPIPDVPTDYDELAAWLRTENEGGYLEGVVWHHADGRMAKIKARDFR